MLQEQIEDIEHPMDVIRKTVSKQLEDLGYTYSEESANYLLTGEATIEKKSEIRLLEDTKYLLMKVRLLEDTVLDMIMEKENEELNRKFPQIDVFGKRVKVKK